MKRKNMLNVFRGFAILGLTLFIMSSCGERKAPKYVGLQLWSVREDMKEDPVATIERVGDMGYTFVEAAGYADGKFYGMAPRVFAEVVQNNGMDFLSSHTSKQMPDMEDWDEALEWWDECIAAHKEAGVDYIVAPSMGKIGYSSLEGLKRTCEYFNTIGEKCNAAGIRFGYHNHTHEFEELEGETIYDVMLQNTDPDKVMFQMDLYWIVEGGKDPVAYFEKYPGRFELWHVKDEAEIGASGKMDFERIYEHADLAGMEYYIVEVEQYNYEPLESVERSLRYLLDAEFVE